MYIKNYKVKNYKEYHKAPISASKRKKVEILPSPENTNVTFNYNVLSFLTTFVIDAFAPLPIEDLIIAVLVGGITANIEE